MKVFKIILFGAILAFAVVGFVFTAVFFAMQFGLLNVRGSIDARNDSITSENKSNSPIDFIRDRIANFTPKPTPKEDLSADYSCSNESANCNWSETREWNVVAGGLSKDVQIINQIALETGVSPRLIASVVVPEQIRFFTSDREVFKRYFEPLKMLGSLSKFSLGVSGIKQDTAVVVEKNALDSNSVFYPGDSYASLLAYKTNENKSDQLFKRLTDEKNHYYSYLYTAIFIKEITAQWERAGYDISNNPEIVATIFNLGFSGSNPNPNPQVGGTTIKVGGSNYSFGKLAGEFYRSNQLAELRP